MTATSSRPIGGPAPPPEPTPRGVDPFYGGGMTEFVEADLSGARFERVSLRNANFAPVPEAED